MPRMNLHNNDLQDTIMKLQKSRDNSMAWIDFSKPGYGDYLTIFLHPDEPTLKFLVDLEALIQEAQAFLASFYLEEENLEND